MRRNIFLAVISFLLSLVLLLPVTSVAQTWREKEDMPDKTFTVIKEVWRTPAKNQARTGTCWCFSTTSFLETELKRLGKGEYELSEIHTVFYAYLEKAKRYLRLWGKTQFDQGGLSHDLIYVVRKYGLVRDSDYCGLLEGETMHNHSELARALKGFLDALLDSREGPSHKWENAFKFILAAYLGPVSGKIDIGGREITPRQFADEVLEIPYDDYIEVTSYSHMPFYAQVELLIPDNWMRYDKYYNVPLDDFIAIMDQALNDGYSLVIDLDVSEATYDSSKGYAIAEEDKAGSIVTQEIRENLFDSHSTTDDHLEHVVGIAKDQEGNKFYLLKDSGGPERGPYNGHTYISENYVRAKILAYMLHKDAVPAEIRTKLGIE